MGISERKLLFLMGSVQFVNILDFMMVQPLGPDFAKALAISVADLGWIVGSYTAAAAISGLISSMFLDRFDRKTVLITMLAGLFAATFVGSLSYNFATLLCSRVMAGCFGGPATAIALAIIADMIPAERRGTALGKVMGAFSLAAVLGVPFGLEASRLFGWRAPFIMVAVVGTLIMVMTAYSLPSLRLHLQKTSPLTWQHIWTVWRIPKYVLSLLANGAAMLAGFMVIPNISAYVQYNLEYPRDHLGYMYMAGGIVSFIVMRIAGKLLDRYKASYVAWGATAIVIVSLFCGFILPLRLHPIIILTTFMWGMAMRNVTLNTNASKVPTLQERAGFMAMMSAIQHMSSAFGAFLASKILEQDPISHRLVHMPVVIAVAGLMMLVTPYLLHHVEKIFSAERPL